MRNLSDIVEDCKLNKVVDPEELKYALLVYVSMMNIASSTIRNMNPTASPGYLVLQQEHIHNVYHTALNRSPKEYLGWNNDPENPEYQKFHAMGNRLLDKALKGELSNQKGHEIKQGGGLIK